MKIERIKHKGKVIAACYRNMSSNEGLNFFTLPERCLQVAIHNYAKPKETNLHRESLHKPTLITEFDEFIYIVKGGATIYLTIDNSKNIVKRLKKDDGMMLINTTHKVVFSEKTKAIEIKQGPYE